jgi:hypothetical protein
VALPADGDVVVLGAFVVGVDDVVGELDDVGGDVTDGGVLLPGGTVVVTGGGGRSGVSCFVEVPSSRGRVDTVGRPSGPMLTVVDTVVGSEDVVASLLAVATVSLGSSSPGTTCCDAGLLPPRPLAPVAEEPELTASWARPPKAVASTTPLTASRRQPLRSDRVGGSSGGVTSVRSTMAWLLAGGIRLVPANTSGSRVGT